jgi:hypothetical protein
MGHLHNFSGPLPLLASMRHQSPLYLSPSPPSAVLFKTECYTYTETHQPTHFVREGGGIIYLRNIGTITHINKV